MKAAQSPAERTSVLVLRGHRALSEGRVDEAIVTLKLAVALSPDGVEPQLQLAYAYETAGELDLAEAAYLAAGSKVQAKAAGPKSERLHPENRARSSVEEGLVRVYMKKGEEARALAVLMESHSPPDAEALLSGVQEHLAATEHLWRTQGSGDR